MYFSTENGEAFLELTLEDVLTLNLIKTELVDFNFINTAQILTQRLTLTLVEETYWSH